MIEQLLVDAPLHREIRVKRSGTVYTFTCANYDLLSKLQHYLYLLDGQQLLYIIYISDIHRANEANFKFTLVYKEP